MARVIPHEGTADGPGWVVLVGRTWKQSPGLRGEGDRAKGFVGRVTLKKVFFFFFPVEGDIKRKIFENQSSFYNGRHRGERGRGRESKAGDECESNTGSLKQDWGVQGTGRGMALAWRGVAGKE